MKAVFVIVAILVLVVWAFIGFMLWVPFLARMISVYVYNVALAIYTGHQIGHAEQALEKALSFYVRGFELIAANLRRIRDHTPIAPTSESPTENWDVAVKETAFATLFWGSTLVVGNVLANLPFYLGVLGALLIILVIALLMGCYGMVHEAHHKRDAALAALRRTDKSESF
jgi:hypothetical protein